jgi:protease-4
MGLVDASGLASGVTYMRHAMDKLGLGVDEWRFFTYKSAFETYSRDSMSDPEREQRQQLVDDAYTNVASTLESARGIDRAEFDSLVDRLAVLRPEEAQAAGLVDSIGDFAAMRRRAPAAVPRSMPTQRAAPLGNLLVDPVWRLEPWGEPPALAVVYATGPVEMDSGLRGRKVASAVRDAAANRDVEAIVVRVDSPGGDVLPSDLVGREVRDATDRKPVIVSQGQVAASGGYWISMYADTILTTPHTLTGSIGVIGGWIWNKDFGDKVGLDYDGVKRGAHADLQRGVRLPVIGVTVPDRALTSEERDRVEQVVRGTYADFVSGVAAGRGLAATDVEALAQGRVWTGTRAVDNGLADGIGGLWEGLHMARAAAGLAPDRVVKIEQGPEPGVFNWRSLVPFRIGGLGLGGDESDASELPDGALVPATLEPWMDPVAPPPVAGDAALLPAVENAFLESLLRHNGRPLLLLPPLEIHDGARDR